MRSLSGALLAAQKALSGVPFVRAVVSNAVRGVRHYVFVETFGGAQVDSRHGAAADATYLHRIRNDSTGATGNAQYQRDASGAWTTMSSAADAVHVAIAAIGTRVVLVYNRGLNIYFRESTDSGATFGAETLVIAAASTVNALAGAYKTGTSDVCVFYVQTATVRRIRRTAGTWGAAASWTQTATTINGLAVTYSGDFELVVTGTETTTLRPTVWSLVLGDGYTYAVDLWTAFFLQVQGEVDELVTFQAPSVAILTGAGVRRITFVEKFTGAPAYTRTYWTGVTPGAAFAPGVWEWQEPAPLNNATTYGYAVTYGKTPAVAIYSRPAQVLEAPNAAVTLDMSADLVGAVIDEKDGLTQRAELVFDNSNGQYAGPPAPIAKQRTVDLALGYDAAYSSLPGQTIVGWSYRRSGGRSLFVLELRGADYWLDRTRSRTSIVDSRVIVNIARAAAARSGLEFLNVASSARAGAFVVEWVVHPDRSQLDVLRALREIVADEYYTFGVGTLKISEPLVGEAVDYTFGTDHAIYKSDWREDLQVSAVEVVAVGVLGSVYDYVTMNSERPVSDRRRSPHETVAADADAHAVALLRRSVLQKDLGELVVPPCCGLEVGDVVGFTDLSVSPLQVVARVKGIKTTLRRRDGGAVYEQLVRLGGR